MQKTTLLSPTVTNHSEMVESIMIDMVIFHPVFNS